MLDTLFSLIKQTPPMLYILFAGLLLLIHSYLKEERSIKNSKDDEYEFRESCGCKTCRELEISSPDK